MIAQWVDVGRSSRFHIGVGFEIGTVGTGAVEIEAVGIGAAEDFGFLAVVESSGFAVTVAVVAGIAVPADLDDVDSVFPLTARLIR